MTTARFAKLVLFINALVPLAILTLDFWRGRLGANPLAYFTSTTGTLTLVFLTLSLAVTPIRKLTGYNFLSHFRKMLGLYAFFYGVLHLLAFMWFDHVFNLAAIVQDTINRPFVTVGMAAFLAMVPLAATSTNTAIRRMGAARWKMLHRLAYVAAVAGVVHYWLLVKVVDTVLLAFAVVVAVLLLMRLIDAVRPKPGRTRAPAAPRTAT